MDEEQNLEFHKSLRLLAKSSVVIFIGIILSKIISYVYRIVVARVYGPEVYGTLSLALMIVGWFVVISSLGITQGMARFIPYYRGKKEKDKIKFIFNSSISFLLISSLVSGVLLFFLAEFISINIFHEEGLIIFLKIFSVLVTATVLMNAFLTVIQAYERPGWYSFIFNILQNLAKLIALVILLLIGLETKAIIFSYLIGIFSGLVVAYLVCRYLIKEIFGKSGIDKKEKKRLFGEVFQYSWPLLFSSLLITIFHWTDSFFIGFFKNVEAVGFYNVAIPIAFFLMVSTELFMQLFYPLATREYSKGNMEVVKELSKQISKWIFTLNLPLFILIFLFPRSFINLLFGSQYLVAGDALRFLIFGVLVNSVLIISNRLITISGRSKLLLIDTLAAFILNIFLNIILIPMPTIFLVDNSNGIVGAALATTISLVFLNSLFLFQSYKTLKIHPFRRKMGLIFLVSLVPTTILIILRNKVGMIESGLMIVLLIILFFLLYFALILLVKGFDRNDLSIIRDIKRKILSYK